MKKPFDSVIEASRTLSHPLFRAWLNHIAKNTPTLLEKAEYRWDIAELWKKKFGTQEWQEFCEATKEVLPVKDSASHTWVPVLIPVLDKAPKQVIEKTFQFWPDFKWERYLEDTLEITVPERSRFEDLELL